MPTRFGPGSCALLVALALATSGRAQGEGPHVLTTPTISEADAAGHRLWILVFDISSMGGLEVARARQISTRWINATVGQDDLVSVVTVGRELTLLQNFTPSPDLARTAVGRVLAPPAPGTGAAPPVDERDYFNNDLRLRGLRTVCEGLEPVLARKALVFFTALKERPGTDNQAEMRATTAACSKARTSINPVDVDQVAIGR